MIKEYIDKNTTILKALDTLQCVHRTNASEDIDLKYVVKSEIGG